MKDVSNDQGQIHWKRRYVDIYVEIITAIRVIFMSYRLKVVIEPTLHFKIQIVQMKLCPLEFEFELAMAGHSEADLTLKNRQETQPMGMGGIIAWGAPHSYKINRPRMEGTAVEGTDIPGS